MSYEAAARASNDKKAFVRATSLLVKNMYNSSAKRLEVACLYGDSGLGQAVSQTGTSATQRVVQLSDATWASGIWAGSEDTEINFYNGASLVSSGADAVFVIAAVDLINKRLTVTGSSTGITALVSAIAAPLDIFYKGAKGKEMAGLNRIVTNAGSLFGIDAAQFALWKGNTFNANGELSLKKILQAVSKAVERGLDEDVVCMVSPATWASLSSSQAALRSYDQSYSSKHGENGSEKYTFHGQNGKIEIHSSIYVKEGEAFIFPPKRLKRIGAMDLNFKMPGREQQEDFFIELSNAAGYELRAYTNQALFCDTPARLVKVTGITN